MKKYRLTTEKIRHSGKDLWRVEALINFDDVKEGQLGGFIESEGNLSHDGVCWAYDDTKIYGNATLRESAKMYDLSELYEKAVVSGEAEISKAAHVFGNAYVDDQAFITGNSKIMGDGNVYGSAKVKGGVIVWENSKVYDDSEILPNVQLSGNSVLRGRCRISGNATISGNTEVCDDVRISGFCNISTNGILRGGMITRGDFFEYLNLNESEDVLVVTSDSSTGIMCSISGFVGTLDEYILWVDKPSNPYLKKDLEIIERIKKIKVQLY